MSEKKTFTPEEMELIRAEKARYMREYMREYRKKNREKEVQRENARFLRKAKARLAAEQESGQDQDHGADGVTVCTASAAV